jgi:hypothetical protein
MNHFNRVALSFWTTRISWCLHPLLSNKHTGTILLLQFRLIGESPSSVELALAIRFVILLVLRLDSS